ncbi:MAG: transporter, family, lincomycin resistance protein, partial [Devosia sp.]|nr:transporter, family, lincomycin resistance protein [Devosia sp.]
MSSDASDFDAVPETAPKPAGLSADNRLVINLLLVSAFVVILNETIMGVALPH